MYFLAYGIFIYEFNSDSFSFSGGKLASLEEFKVHREELMAKFAQMEKDLEQKDEDHKASIYDLEKKAVLDKSR